MILSIWSK